MAKLVVHETNEDELKEEELGGDEEEIWRRGDRERTGGDETVTGEEVEREDEEGDREVEQNTDNEELPQVRRRNIMKGPDGYKNIGVLLLAILDLILLVSSSLRSPPVSLGRFLLLPPLHEREPRLTLRERTTQDAKRHECKANEQGGANKIASPCPRLLSPSLSLHLVVLPHFRLSDCRGSSLIDDVMPWKEDTARWNDKSKGRGVKVALRPPSLILLFPPSASFCVAKTSSFSHFFPPKEGGTQRRAGMTEELPES